MEVESLRFGTIEFDAEQVIEFQEGLLGFPDLHRFVHVAPAEWEPVECLVSLDEPRLSFPLVNPHLIRPDYRLATGDGATPSIGPGSSGAVMVYGVTTFGKSSENSTINLLAPVLIDPTAGLGRQVVLEESGYGIAEPLLEGRC